MMEARAKVQGMIDAYWTTQAIYAACQLGLPDALAHGAMGAEALARASASHPESLRRLLRALASLGLCVERTDGAFELTAEGHVLTRESEASLRHWALMTGGRLWGSWGQLARCVSTGESVRKRQEGREDFGALDLDPDAAEAFNRAMLDLTRPVARAFARLLEPGEARLAVDVGGGCGELLAAVLARHGRLQGIVFDMAHAVEGARRHLAEAGVGSRAEVIAGSFFDAVPEGDLLLLKSIVHDWTDARAAAILERCAAALRPGGRLVLVERVAPERFADTTAHRNIARSDLNMLVNIDGCERTEARFRSLLAAAGLRLLSVEPLVNDFSALTAVRSAT
jgi:precorrin-6B methylase 2